MTNLSSAKPRDSVGTVTCIGGGLIGVGWAAHFLRAGLKVVVYDVAPERAEYINRTLDAAMPTLVKLGLSPGASRDNVRFTTDLGDALSSADFVQESATENLDAKTSLLAEIDAALAPDVVIASSSSGFLASDLRSKAKNGHRIIIGHPFNPPYLVPLVELAGGDQAPGAVAKATTFYRSTGCEVVELSREIDGYIGNRIQFAVFKEILYLLSQGVADLESIDRAITSGPALRWAVMGPSSVFFLGARDVGLYGDFVKLLSEELASGYAAPPDFVPDPALLRRYADEVTSGIGALGQAPLLEKRDLGVASIRLALARLASTGAGQGGN
ncbi:L-carnitine dehydrogenase [Paraburkholderia sp. UYCP14C]|uniref:3-hydroxyacyl-CoA dehydrogenase NAD-binding domain-containing protein n=1 Tax=Paraburkholderia sp. UYCP14C TaxID=2511130 RepID=UPI0010211129|nr:3-hydroxyacyl-CoA dehydrogenase NAD-binding domain-containing protein [Paraburkholderia sp. UYCP14C]RZF23933.1 L-carnitine dehydrogenase [Paraburkholderia sp. UYCP14C]